MLPGLKTILLIIGNGGGADNGDDGVVYCGNIKDNKVILWNWKNGKSVEWNYVKMVKSKSCRQ